MNIKGKGYAAHSQGDKMFTIQPAITSIGPTSAASNGKSVL